ncbi:MAG: hypothetical protein ACYDA5_04835 [Vulcanimicrobiaceae bacterium]
MPFEKTLLAVGTIALLTCTGCAAPQRTPQTRPTPSAAATRPIVAQSAQSPPPTASPQSPAAAPTPAPRPLASPPATLASPLPELAPSPTGSPMALSTVAPAPTPAPRASVQPKPPIVMLAPNAPPRILSYSIDRHVVHPGQSVAGSVRTSSNVAAVLVEIDGIEMGANKVGEGHFALRYTVPKLPFFLRGHSYTMMIIARNAAGASTTRAVPIYVR